MKSPLFFRILSFYLYFFYSQIISAQPPVNVTSSRMGEVFRSTILSGANVLNDPWEITYGPDNNLWITEAKGYKVYKMDPNTGSKTMVLNVSSGSTFLPSPADSLNAVNSASWSPWPQGGFAGLALHPNFLDGSGLHDYVYVAYVHRFLGGSSPSGLFYRNKLVRFTYNSGTGLLGSPVVLCDTLPGSKDHNSQRMIIAPVTPGGTQYLFYASGDMGSGQFENRTRAQKAQNPASYEGKILRFNLEPDGDAGAAAWIPNDNPYASTSAVWDIGMRNNQGFAYDTALNILYGSSHGPFSDDEINIIEPFKNYGHPLVIGYVADGNYNGTTGAPSSTNISAGSPWPTASGVSTCPPIGNEATNRAAIDANGNGLYKDPVFSAYPGPSGSGPGTVANIWATNPSNSGWPSEGWSGLDLYTNTVIPGWKKSLIAAGLKWGRLIRLKMGAAGTTVIPTDGGDTVTYFQSINRYRDLAIAPDGRNLYLIMDKSSATSGPSTGSPIVPACPGCVVKYTFLGYEDAGGKSAIPSAIDVTDGAVNTCNSGTTVTIDATNNNLWVPITGPDGNIMAEIFADGQNLGTITSSFYKHSGAIRSKNGVHYLDRNITVTPQTQPVSPVKIRLYLSKAEFDALDADPLGSVNAISDLNILKNSDPCSSAVAAMTNIVSPDFTAAHGSNGYVLQATISGFSSFYFAASNFTLPLKLLTFSGVLQNNTTTLLQWKTTNEIKTKTFTIERSIDGIHFSSIGSVTATGNTIGSDYLYTDNNVYDLQALSVYYRLKILDNDGSSEYSSVISITLPGVTNNVLIYPNPVSKELSVSIISANSGKVQLKIVDNTGRIIFSNSYQVRKGQNVLNINTDGMSVGLYYIKVNGIVNSQPLKMIKTK